MPTAKDDANSIYNAEVKESLERGFLGQYVAIVSPTRRHFIRPTFVEAALAGGIRCMPSGFMPVVIDLRPSMKVMIPWGKPRGIRCMPSGFMPVVIDLRPSMKVTIPWGKPRGIQWSADRLKGG